MTKQRVHELKNRLSKHLGEYSQSVEFEMFFSALIDFNPYNSTEEILQWLKELNNTQYFSVEEISFSELQQWHFDNITGDLKHNRGKFFSIRGFQVFNSWSGELLWDQPIIDQPEIGVLGILCKKMDGVLYFLMQAKAEPGNINTYQISPTVQATRSNYMQAHGGLSTRYLEYFNGVAPVKIIFYQYQSEQGARFMEKRNRNIIVYDESSSLIELSENHRWLTMGQIKSMMEHDNTVNMDCRSVISQIRYWNEENVLDTEKLLCILNDYRDVISRSDFWLKSVSQSFAIHKSDNELNEIKKKLDWKRFFCFMSKKPISLNEVKHWNIGDKTIEHISAKYFQVLAVRIKASNREVDGWDQPIMSQRHNGVIGILATDIGGEIRFLVQMKIEPGLYDLVELAPTVQCIEQNYDSDPKPNFLEAFRRGPFIYGAKQSEEGGRFYRECSSNIIKVIDSVDISDDQNYLWISLKHLKELVQTQQMLNVELRSLLAYF
ncbi:MAG: NDP-hexose 2,3-dehydratase family protein [Candidatus Cloacimonadaceae bacterium]|nr:NDP-hexose 2,3-dehydratase family protein [Candidatus Cloacimonadaceae bacterium]